MFQQIIITLLIDRRDHCDVIKAHEVSLNTSETENNLCKLTKFSCFKGFAN